MQDLNGIDFLNYVYNAVSQLEDDEIQNNSFEILNIVITLWSNFVYEGIDVEKVLEKCFIIESNKVRETQNIYESIRKYKEIVPFYMDALDTRYNDVTFFLLDYVQDFKFSVMQQLDTALKNESTKENIINFLKKEDSNKLFIDKDILEVLEQNGIKFKATISIKDVKDAAIRTSISIDELTGDFEFTIENKGREQ